MINADSDNILLVDKPSGITSFEVIRRLRRAAVGSVGSRLKLGKKIKIGHAGTLDPLATGLLIVGFGSGTKKLSFWLGQDKTYEVDVLLGRRTDSGDITGRTVAKSERMTTEKEVSRVVGSLVGDLDLPVPKFSAVKVAGRPLYRKAYQGLKFDPPVRTMTVKEAKLMSFDQTDDQVVRLEMSVKSGVYIRSVAEFLGSKLKTEATVSALRRTQIGSLSLAEAVKLSDLEESDLSFFFV